MATDTEEQTMTVQDLATLADGFLVRGKRTNGDEFWKFKDGRPDWCQDMAREAHGDMMPDDWKYEFISDSLSALSECDDEEEARDSLEPSVYYSDQLKWFSSHMDRPAYVDTARHEFGDVGGRPVMEMVAQGMAQELDEVFGLVLSFLQNKVEEEGE